MTCREGEALLSAYVDRELDVATSLQMEAHVAECRRCSAAVEGLEALRATIGSAALTYPPPPDLARGIRAAVGSASSPVRAGGRRRWIAAPAAAALAAMLGWVVLGTLTSAAARQRVLGEVVAGHVRSLMVDHLVDVASADRHTVRPWFNGKIDYAPPVTDFAASGFPLVGGRLDYIDGRSVAVLVYRHEPHLVNVFVWPSREGDASPQAVSAQGYSLVRWSDAGLEYWAISDLNAHDLERLADLVRTASPPPAARE